ncbi:protein of unknown function [Pseudomonas sp. JV241A]|nr:protein of unknown function [Pseudomonas sp. JV241A]
MFFLEGLLLLPSGLEVFQLDAVAVGLMFIVEHADQLALLMHIPDAHACSQAFVRHFAFVALSYFDSHLQTPLSVNCGTVSQVSFIEFVSRLSK